MFGSRFGISSAAIAAVSFLAFQTNADKIQDYFGCYTDVQSERVLSDKFKLVDSTQMTTEFCIDHCYENGGVFAGTQFGEECWCSDDPNVIYWLHTFNENPECSIPCPGDEMENCGGFNAFDLYYIDDEVTPGRFPLAGNN